MNPSKCTIEKKILGCALCIERGRGYCSPVLDKPKPRAREKTPTDNDYLRHSLQNIFKTKLKEVRN